MWRNIGFLLKMAKIGLFFQSKIVRVLQLWLWLFSWFSAHEHIREWYHYKRVWKGFNAFLLKEANGKYFQKVLEVNNWTIARNSKGLSFSCLKICQSIRIIYTCHSFQPTIYLSHKHQKRSYGCSFRLGLIFAVLEVFMDDTGCHSKVAAG